MEPKVSVLMAIYNEEAEYLMLAINSILNQSFDNFEFIIVLDNPENIKLKKIVKSFMNKDERIILLENKKNLGLAFSLNKGINIAKGKYIARMDADDIAVQSRLKIQYEFMENNKSVDLLFSWIKHIDEKGNKINFFKPLRSNFKNIDEVFFKKHFLIHPTLFCKKKVLSENKFDSNFRRSQDFELWLRLIKKYNFDVVEQYLLDYRLIVKVGLKRLEKVKAFNYWTLKALNKNFSLHKLKFSFYTFYIKNLVIRIIMLLPSKILLKLVVLKNRVNVNG